MSAPWKADPELTDMEEEDLWEMIEKHRCKIVQKLLPERLTPYLRQTKVLDEMDEEEILHSVKFPTRAMRLGHLLDILRTRGKNGAIAFLDSLILANPKLYTIITGKEASNDPNSFSKLIDRSQLSVLLMSTLSSLQDELMQEKQLKGTLVHHLRKMREKQQQLEEEGESVRSMEYEIQRLRRDIDAQCQMISKLKDEQYELSMRYSHALQEKDSVQSKNSELQEQLYSAKEELYRVRMELQVAQSWTSRAQCEEELLTLKTENRKLRDRLEQPEHNKPVELDNNQGSDGNIPSSEELMAQLTAAKKKIAAGEALEKLLQEEKKALLQESNNLQSSNDTLKKMTEAFHKQVSDLQKERDQAYRARDMVQGDISCFLEEKDSLRQQVMDLTESNANLKQQIHILETQLQSQRIHQRLVRMDAICPSEDGDKGSSSCTSESWQDLSCKTSSDLGECMSCFSFQDDYLPGLTKRSCSNELPDILQDEKTETDSEFDLEDRKGLQTFSHLEIGDCSSLLSTPVRRRYARRITSRATIIAFQGDDLLKQISIIGGNKTGIFIHQVTPGSAADEMSLMPGHQIMAIDFDVVNPAYRVGLGGMTLEDAHCTLNRVNGFCCLSIRSNIEEYRKLVNDIQSSVVTSGDSFYVRVNQSVSCRIDGGLKVSCGEILHVTSTMFKHRRQWFACRVNAYTMKDGDSGIIPNYRQAQQQLVTAIQSMTWQNMTPRRPGKEVRIVSTDRCSSHLLWKSQDCGICRCEECLTDAEYAARNQRGDIIGEKEGEGPRCWYTRQNVESVAQQNAHCLLELGLSCLSSLIRVGIYPIILHIPLTEKNTKRLKKTRYWWGKCEELLLECAQREESELDALPCLYRTVDPESWNDTESLLCSVKNTIMDEQKRIVWLENQTC